MTRRLQMSGITKSFFATRALDNVDFACTAGQVHALVGLNGAGKSTLMKVLGGVIEADAGTSEIDGKAVQIARPADASALGINMIHQEYSLINELTVAGNIFLGREIRHVGTPFLNHAEMRRRVSEQLDRFGLALDPDRPVWELNSGEKQIVEIVRALMADSWLIVMDEPTSALSEQDKERLFRFIAAMKAQGIAIIYISHHMPEIFSIAEEITVMRDGQVVLASPVSDTSQDAVIHAMTGKELEDFVKPHKTMPDEVVLEVTDLSLAGAYEGLNLKVRAGEVVVMTGLRGCGGPELARTLFGLEKPDRGEIRFKGQPVMPGQGAARAVRDGMGLVTENRDKDGILSVLSVRDNIALPFLGRYSRSGLMDSGLLGRVVDGAIDKTSIKTASAATEIRFLSGGNKQKVCLSRWMDQDLKLLILLEPTRGIDVHAKADIYRTIERMAEQGMAVLVLSYEVDEVVLLADTVLTLHQGQIVGSHRYPELDKRVLLSEIAGAARPAQVSSGAA